MKEKFVQYLLKGIREKVEALYDGDLEDYIQELHYNEIVNHLDQLKEIVLEVVK